MNVLDWLMEGDPAIQRLTSKYLLGDVMSYNDSGYIKRYLDLFDESTGLWGGGAYGPKWISTHYTLLELKYMEIDPTHPFYHRGLSNVIDHEWRSLNGSLRMSLSRVDVCVLAMLVSLSAYGKSKDPRLPEMIDFIIDRQMPDGGWNCSWNPTIKRSMKSSLHTTLSVLEAFKDLIQNDYHYESQKIKALCLDGEEFILKKKLCRSVTTGEVIHPDFLKYHYPTRWKYDVLRALEYFSDRERTYDVRMQEGLEIISHAMDKGYLLKGSQYSGRLHFKLETTRGGRFNTLRALKVLKFYMPERYQELIEKRTI